MNLRFGDEKALTGQAAAADLAADLLLRGTRDADPPADPGRARPAQGARPPRRAAARAPHGGRRDGPRVAAGGAGAGHRVPARGLLPGEGARGAAARPTWPASSSRRASRRPSAMIAFNRHVNPWPKGDVRYVPLPEEQIADYRAATLAEREGASTPRSYGGQVGEVAVVGDFDQAAVPGGAGEGARTAGRPATPFARVARPYRAVRRPSGSSWSSPTRPTPSWPPASPCEIRDDDADWPALVMGNYMLGGGFLNSRLAVRIRQKEGLSYGVGSSLSASPLDRSGRFMAYAIFAPQNEARLLTALNEELAARPEGRLHRGGAQGRQGRLAPVAADGPRPGRRAGAVAGHLELPRAGRWPGTRPSRRRWRRSRPADVLAAHEAPPRPLQAHRGDGRRLRPRAAAPGAPAAPAAPPARRPRPRPAPPSSGRREADAGGPGTSRCPGRPRLRGSGARRRRPLAGCRARGPGAAHWHDLELDPAVLGAPGGGLVVGDGARRAEALRLEAAGLDAALLDQPPLHRRGPAGREVGVVRRRSPCESVCPSTRTLAISGWPARTRATAFRMATETGLMVSRSVSNCTAWRISILSAVSWTRAASPAAWPSASAAAAFSERAGRSAFSRPPSRGGLLGGEALGLGLLGGGLLGGEALRLGLRRLGPGGGRPLGLQALRLGLQGGGPPAVACSARPGSQVTRARSRTGAAPGRPVEAGADAPGRRR